MSNKQARNRPNLWKGALFLFIAAGIAITTVRFAAGLGTVTGLSDIHPWGLWKGFNILCGAGLAAGGFLVAAGVHIFHLDRYRAVVRSAILGACLGQLFLLTSLLIDLGRPWNIWHALFMGNPDSVMFELAWAIALFTVVLGGAFSGTLFESLNWKHAARLFDLALVPMAISGVVLAAVVQTLLGSLYLIFLKKLHPFWYTDWLPLLFFVSSIALGLALVVVLSHLAANVNSRVLPQTLLRDVGRILVHVLIFFAVLRLFDLWERGVLLDTLGVSYEARMFQIEFLVGVLLPAGLLAIPAIRKTHFGLYASCQLVILGFITNRLNVCITGFEAAQGGYYVPAFSEILITLILVATAMGLFGISVLHLDIYPGRGGDTPIPGTFVEPVPGPGHPARRVRHLDRVR